MASCVEKARRPFSVERQAREWAVGRGEQRNRVACVCSRPFRLFSFVQMSAFEPANASCPPPPWLSARKRSGCLWCLREGARVGEGGFSHVSSV